LFFRLYFKKDGAAVPAALWPFIGPLLGLCSTARCGTLEVLRVTYKNKKRKEKIEKKRIFVSANWKWILRD
jgi:hypothetical protein